MIRKSMALTLLKICLFSTTAITASIDEKILHVENGLLPLDSGFGVFLRAGADTSKKMNLLDRMKHYRVPGVGIAGMMCILIALPERGQGAVIMTNGLDGDKLYHEILFSIAVEYGWKLMYE